MILRQIGGDYLDKIVRPVSRAAIRDNAVSYEAVALYSSKRVEAQGIADYQKILSTCLSDKQLQYETIKAQKEIALSSNTKIIIMGNNKGAPVLINGN